MSINVLNVFDEETVIIPVISMATQPLEVPIISQINVPALEFPRFYIVAPGRATERGETQRLAVYRFETAPDVEFDAWLRSIIEPHAEDLAAMVQSHEPRWSLADRYRVINDLVEQLGIALPWYTSYEAATVAAMEVK
jgi:hypothetical protein